MNFSKLAQKKINEGNEPKYQTKKGKLLWIDTERYDSYSQATGAKILVGANNQFWGYSNSDKLFDNYN